MKKFKLGYGFNISGTMISLTMHPRTMEYYVLVFFDNNNKLGSITLTLEKFNEHIEWEEDVPNMAYDENSLSAGIDGSGTFTAALNGNIYLIRDKIFYINGRVSSEEKIPKEVMDEYNRCTEWLKTQK